MKIASVRFRIVFETGTHFSPPSWTIVEKATGKIVWRGKTFKGARTAHVMREHPEIGYRAAHRMGT